MLNSYDPDSEISKQIMRDSKRMDDSDDYLEKLRSDTKDKNYLELNGYLSTSVKKFSSMLNNINSLTSAAIMDLQNSDNDFYDPIDNASSALKNTATESRKEYDQYMNKFLDSYKVESKLLGDSSEYYIPDSLKKGYLEQLKYTFENAIDARKYMAVQLADLQKNFCENQLSYIDSALDNANKVESAFSSNDDMYSAISEFIEAFTKLSEEYHYISDKLGKNPDPSADIVQPKSYIDNDLKNDLNKFKESYDKLY